MFYFSTIFYGCTHCSEFVYKVVELSLGYM